MIFQEWVLAHNIPFSKKESLLEPLYPLVTVASYLGRSVETLRAWERKGLIDKPSSEGKGGRRFYSSADVEVIVKRASHLLRVRSQNRSVVRNCRVRMADGIEALVRLYPISQIVKASGKSLSTIQRMEKDGRLPKTTLLGERNTRLFTYKMIKVVEEAFQQKRDWKDFTTRVTAAWKEEGFYGGVVVAISGTDS